MTNPDRCGSCTTVCPEGQFCAAQCRTLEDIPTDGAWLYEVLAVWSPSSASSSEPLDEEFESVRLTVNLNIEDDRATIQISDPAGVIPSFSGSLRAASAGLMVYDLTGASGGTLELRVEDRRIVAELTEFGSGVPIVRVTRGEVPGQPV